MSGITITDMQRLDKLARLCRQGALNAAVARKSFENAAATYLTEAIEIGCYLREAKGILAGDFEQWLSERLQHLPAEDCHRWLALAEHPEQPVLKSLKKLGVFE